MGITQCLVPDVMVVINHPFVGPSQKLGMGISPVRSAEFSLNGLIKGIPIHVLNVLAVWYELEELATVYGFPELGGKIHNGIPFSLSDDLTQPSLHEVTGFEDRSS